MSSGRALNVVYAVESLLPPRGGAERFALEWIEALAVRHEVRLVQVEDAASDAIPYWAVKRERRETLERAVAEELAARPADVVATALHGAPGAIAAATAARVPSVLFLPSYESLCRYAFDYGSECRPESGCRECPRALALAPDEREELLRSRAEHERAVADAAELVTNSHSLAAACERWTGRRPEVIAPVAPTGAPADGDPAGHLLLAAARWSPNKGAELLEPLARALPERRLLITDGGLEPAAAERLAARPNVRLVPNGPLPELLRGAAAILVPSLWEEPFGRVAFEGMAAGVPAIASARGGLREFVPAARLVDPPESIERWTAAVRALDEDWAGARDAALEAAASVRRRDSFEAIEAVLTRAARRV